MIPHASEERTLCAGQAAYDGEEHPIHCRPYHSTAHDLAVRGPWATNTGRPGGACVSHLGLAGEGLCEIAQTGKVAGRHVEEVAVDTRGRGFPAGLAQLVGEDPALVSISAFSLLLKGE